MFKKYNLASKKYQLHNLNMFTKQCEEGELTVFNEAHKRGNVLSDCITYLSNSENENALKKKISGHDTDNFFQRNLNI